MIFGGTGCILCEKVRAWCEAWAKEYGFSVRYVDVREDEGLEAEYGESIPVVLAAGREVGRGQISEAQLHEAIIEAV